VTRYLESLRAGRQPRVDEWNEHLAAFHARGGVTMEPLRTLRVTGEGSSYELLCERLHALVPDARAIVDVGCGDGELIANLRARYGSGVELVGVDLSAEEIARARERNLGATFVCGDAYDVDIVRCDAIVAHLSLLSFGRQQGILERIRATLLPGGAFVGIIEDPASGGSLFAYIGAAVECVRKRLPGFSPAVPCAARLIHDSDVEAALYGAGFTRVSIERFTLEGRPSPEELWETVRSVYAIGLLERDELEEVRACVYAMHAERAGGDATVEMTLPLRLVAAFVP
jgi:SAM-dependent methyltransferase